MASIFTRIIDGEFPGQFVWRDELAVCFLSINPIQRGHALVIPRVEVDHWLDLDASLSGHLMEVAHAVGRGQMQAFGPPRVSLMIAGLDVPHVHLHVVPMHGIQDMSFANAAATVDPEDFAAAATELRDALRSLGYHQASE